MVPSARLRGVDVALGGRRVLHDVDLEIGPGVTVVRGANGAGKTTLLRALAGLVPLSRGIREAPPLILALGHRPQLLRALTARENLSFFSRYAGSATDRVAVALASWDVPADLPVGALSAGQRRRAALARLDAEAWDLALLDEPFAELDDDAARSLGARLAALGDAGRTVVVATHGHAELAAARTVTLAGGRIT